MLSKRISSFSEFLVSEMTENPTAKYIKFWFLRDIVGVVFQSATLSI